MLFQSQLVLPNVCFAAFAAAAPGKDLAPGVEERAVCNADNVLRALRASPNSVSASLFCYSLIRQGVPTTTLVTAGMTPPPV